MQRSPQWLVHSTPETWILFGILFLWQFSHFHAIACMYRKALSQIVVSLLLLISATLAPAFVHMALLCRGPLLLGIVFLSFRVQICKERTYGRARRLPHFRHLHAGLIRFFGLRQSQIPDLARHRWIWTLGPINESRCLYFTVRGRVCLCQTDDVSWANALSGPENCARAVNLPVIGCSGRPITKEPLLPTNFRALVADL